MLSNEGLVWRGNQDSQEAESFFVPEGLKVGNQRRDIFCPGGTSDNNHPISAFWAAVHIQTEILGLESAIPLGCEEDVSGNHIRWCRFRSTTTG